MLLRDGAFHGRPSRRGGCRSTRRSIDCPPMFEARFQTFEEPTERAASAARVAALRAELKRRGFDGFIVPRADRHQGEYVPPSEARLVWLTGFTGSGGTPPVLSAQAPTFLHGR